MNDNRYAAKNAFLYTMLITILLLIPTYLYIVYLKSVYEIQYELRLKHQAQLVVRSMEEYSAEEKKAFDYPRFRSFQSGLYDSYFNPVFTLIAHPIHFQEMGYHIDQNRAYLVVSLPEKRYFNADYLVVSGELSYAQIYRDAVLILMSIAGVVFLLSLFFLNRFALPFQRLNKRLDRFIKDSMHEINTPLAIINVNIDLFNRTHPQNKYLQRIKAAAKTLAALYNDMDYLIKNERLSFEYEMIDLSRYLKERCDYFSEVASLKNLRIVQSIEPDIQIFFNPTQLERIIDNNLSNAIKYSHEEGMIEVILEKTAAGCYVRFKDQGIGIEDVERIFERYYRENTDKGGFGIGLNIVKSIIDKADIRLEIDSIHGEGSTFSYLFPPSMIR